MLYTAIFHSSKNDKFLDKKLINFLIFAQNIASVPTISVLEQKGEQNVYPCKPQFYYIKVGCKGVYITMTCYPDVHVDLLSLWSMVLPPPPPLNCLSNSLPHIKAPETDFDHVVN